jgi:hypothetical protein
LYYRHIPYEKIVFCDLHLRCGFTGPQAETRKEGKRKGGESVGSAKKT